MLPARCLLIIALAATSLASHAATILTQNFEAGSPPVGWSRAQSVPSAGWEFGPSLGSPFCVIPAHTRYAASNDDAHDNLAATLNLASADRIISPAMNLTGFAGQEVLLSFQYVQPGNFGSTGSVELSLNDGPWFEVAALAPSLTWTTANISLTQFNIWTSVRVALRHNDHGQWADCFAADDLVIQGLLTRDVAMQGLALPSHIAVGATSIMARVLNQGASTVTSLSYSYQVDGGATFNATIGGLNIATGQLALIPHPLPYNFAAPGSYTVNLAVTGVNGSSDLNASNNVASGVLDVLTQVPTKYVVLEQHTGAWCQFCPDGTVAFNQARALDPRVIAVSMHNNDAMAITDGLLVSNALISGFPSGLVDRHLFAGMANVGLNRNQWVASVSTRLNELVSAGVSLPTLSYNAQTRTLSATVQASFYGPTSGDLRLNLWVIEDSVTGSGPGYDQTNGSNATPGHPFSGAGNPIIGFVHDGVVRAMLGGAWGSDATIPNPALAGDTFTKSYQYVLPAGHDPGHIRVVGLLQRFGVATSLDIINAIQAPLPIALFANGFE